MTPPNPTDTALIEQMKAEPIMDGGDGPFVEIWKADFTRLLALAEQGLETKPIDMLLFCPSCGLKHVDKIDPINNPGWENPPHISHKCLSCGCIWRPADVPTNGVETIRTAGKTDTLNASALDHSGLEREKIRREALLEARDACDLIRTGSRLVDTSDEARIQHRGILAGAQQCSITINQLIDEGLAPSTSEKEAGRG